jgi:hypothetical protein
MQHKHTCAYGVQTLRCVACNTHKQTGIPFFLGGFMMFIACWACCCCTSHFIQPVPKAGVCVCVSVCARAL